MWTHFGFLIPIIVFQVVYCKSYHSPFIARSPTQFQWQSQSLGGGQGQSLYMFPVISGIGSGASSENGGIKIIHLDDQDSQKQSQFSNIHDDVIKIPSINNKKMPNNNGASYMYSSMDKNGNIKIKISSPNIQSIADNMKIPTISEDSEEQDSARPVIRYVYTSSNKKGNEDNKNKNIIKIYAPAASASASASASSSGDGHSQSQTVTIHNGHIVKEIIDNNDKDEDETEVPTQVQIQSTAFDSYKGQSKNKPSLRGKTNVVDKKESAKDEN